MSKVSCLLVENAGFEGFGSPTEWEEKAPWMAPAEPNPGLD